MNGQPVERDRRIALGQKWHKRGSEGEHEEQESNQTGHDGEGTARLVPQVEDRA